ncbi:TRAP-type C4-dicarboxylate transport system, small permease component [Cronobacter sakazakii]|nr:TRAP-type C4-dicarboxylate transport system, small permease component [Cronobacter sakazakii]
MLFVASAVSKKNIETVVRAMLPFYGVLLIVLAMVTYIPAISLWLPRVLGMMSGRWRVLRWRVHFVYPPYEYSGRCNVGWVSEAHPPCSMFPVST